MAAIDLGDVVPLTVETRDAAGVLADAGAVVLTIQLPDNTTLTPTVTHSGTGTYQVDYTTTMAGPHRIRWVATGLNTSAYADTITVSEAYPRYLGSLAATKEQLKFTSSDSDEQLRGFMESATEIIENYTGLALVRRTETEDHDLCYSTRKLVLNRSPVISVTSVALVDGTFSWPVADLYVSKASGIVTTLPTSTWFYGHVEAVYVVGLQVIPRNYVGASDMIVESLWSTRRGAKGPPRRGSAVEMVDIPGMNVAIPKPALELLGAPPVWVR